jgi:hypothetical protein
LPEGPGASRVPLRRRKGRGDVPTLKILSVAGKNTPRPKTDFAPRFGGLLKDGKIRFAIEKERVTRKKHDGGNDTAAIKYLLNAEGIKFSDLQLVVQNTYSGMLAFSDRWLDGDRLLDGQVPVVTVSHHLAHAYSAFGMCPYLDIGLSWTVSDKTQLYAKIDNVTNLMPPDVGASTAANSIYDVVGRMYRIGARFND